MTKLADLALRDILPPSIADDDQITALANALDTETQAIVADLARYLPFLAKLDNLPERIVDLLAWQFHLDYYEADAPIATKRALVRDAIRRHRIQGTKAAVLAILDRFFGAGNSHLAEWFEYGGDPYTFTVFTGVMLDAATLARFERAIAVAKNVRSHCTLAQMDQGTSATALGVGIADQQVLVWRSVV